MAALLFHHQMRFISSLCHLQINKWKVDGWFQVWHLHVKLQYEVQTAGCKECKPMLSLKNRSTRLQLAWTTILSYRSMSAHLISGHVWLPEEQVLMYLRWIVKCWGWYYLLIYLFALSCISLAESKLKEIMPQVQGLKLHAGAHMLRQWWRWQD